MIEEIKENWKVLLGTYILMGTGCLFRGYTVLETVGLMGLGTVFGLVFGGLMCWSFDHGDWFDFT